MEPPHATRYHGTDLLSAQRYDRIHLFERDARHALRAEVRDVDLLLGQGLDCERIDVAGLGAGAQEAVSQRGHRTRQTFGHLAAGGIANAEKQNCYRDLPPPPVPPSIALSSAWCLIDFPSTRNTTSSAMLVARSATRSRFRLTRNSSMAVPMMCGSSIMCVSRIRNIDAWSASTLSSRRQMARPACASPRTNASSASASIVRACRAISSSSGSGTIGRLASRRSAD